MKAGKAGKAGKAAIMFGPRRGERSSRTQRFWFVKTKTYKPILTIVIVASAAALWHWDNAQSVVHNEPDAPGSSVGARTAAVKVLTQPVAMISNDRVFEAIGTARARLSIKIYPAVPENVTGVFFEAEQNVTAGTLLVRLDDRAEKLAVDLAEVRLKDVRSLLDRYEHSINKGGVPQSELDATRADFEAAQIALKQARVNLEDRRIKAPFDGVVGMPQVDPGERVTPDTLITGLDDRKILYVDYEIPEALASPLYSDKADQAVTVMSPAYPGRTFPGTITSFGSRVDPERRTVTVRASIDNPEDLLRPGMSFTIRWNIPGTDYPAVPQISLQWDREGSFVWTISDGVAHRIPVRGITRSSGQLLVSGDIAQGDAVVVEGMQRLREGALVEALGSR